MYMYVDVHITCVCVCDLYISYFCIYFLGQGILDVLMSQSTDSGTKLLAYRQIIREDHAFLKVLGKWSTLKSEAVLSSLQMDCSDIAYLTAVTECQCLYIVRHIHGMLLYG